MARDADKFVGLELGSHGSSYLMTSIFLSKQIMSSAQKEGEVVIGIQKRDLGLLMSICKKKLTRRISELH